MRESKRWKKPRGVRTTTRRATSLESKRSGACAPSLSTVRLSLYEDRAEQLDEKRSQQGGKGKRRREACQFAQKAKTMGEKNPDGFFADEVPAIADRKCR